MNQMRNFFGNGGMNGGINLPGPLGNVMNIMNLFNQFRQNPIGALMQIGYNVPQNLQNNSEAIVNYLRNSGQMDDQTYNQCSQMANQFQSIMPKNFR